ncbi:MAG TPA: hypothetical protein ENK52_00355 [Saprospiraceae bacterium]|nr:hypothetical protein [Saprospiraceae bacterium]
MKKLLKSILPIAFLFVFLMANSACSKKTGCPMNDPKRIGAKTDKKGNLKSKRKKSTNLFPKDMRRGSKKRKH